MRILMFGRGAIATFYGWALEQAGHDVEFYVRPGRAAEYGDGVSLDLIDFRRGLRGKRVTTSWAARYRESLDSDNDFDLIVVSLPHHRLAEATSFLAPRLGDATVLMFSNFWVEPSEVIGDIPSDRVAWGFPFAGGGFGTDGVLRGTILPSVIFGRLAGQLSDRELAARMAFRNAGFRIAERENFRGWIWVHFASNVGFHSQGVRAGSLSKLIGRPRDLREALLVAREFLPVVAARGVDLRKHRSDTLIFRAPSGLMARVFGFAISHVTSARLNFEAQSAPNAEEPRAIVRDALASAHELGIPVPRLEAAVVGSVPGL